MDRCPFCSCTNLVIDNVRGNTACGRCGEVLAEKDMVTETSFVQNTAGSISASGVFMSWSGGQGGGIQQNQDLAVSRGMEKLTWIADRMQLGSEIQEAGRRMYRLAVQMNFNIARSTRLVASACLYLVCRRNRSPHLLIDFSDVLQTPVLRLGKVYMRLLRRLVGGDSRTKFTDHGVQIPAVDPSVFIERFSRKLELGRAQRAVKTTAMRIIQYMNTHWICVGRRPSGISAAALLFGAAYHGIKCSAKEVADIVRMSEHTVKLRLVELRATPMYSMSRKDFELADKNQSAVCSVPPCFFRRWGSAFVDPSLLGVRDDGVVSDSSVVQVKTTSDQDRGAAVEIGEIKAAVLPIDNAQPLQACMSEEPTAQDIHGAVQEITAALLTEDGTSLGEIDNLVGVASQKLDALVAGKPEFGEPETKRLDTKDEDETLDEVNLDDYEFYLLDDEEQQHKSDIWHEVNKDYLEEWHIRGREAAKRKRQAEDAASSSSRNKRSAPQEQVGQHTSCVQAAMMALSQKRKINTNRINVDALESLFS